VNSPLTILALMCTIGILGGASFGLTAALLKVHNECLDDRRELSRLRIENAITQIAIDKLHRRIQ